jgi:hypothetical protein
VGLGETLVALSQVPTRRVLGRGYSVSSSLVHPILLDVVLLTGIVYGYASNQTDRLQAMWSRMVSAQSGEADDLPEVQVPLLGSPAKGKTMSREIPLTQGHVAIVDDEDFKRVNQYKWCAMAGLRRDGTIKCIYATRSIRVNGRKITQYLHRFILEISDPTLQIDHIDHNGLNNQRSNLRTATRSENQWNQRKLEGCSSPYKGVTLRKSDAKWVAEIKVNGKKHYLGCFADEQDAAIAYNRAAVAHFGDFAHINQLPR